MAKLKLRKLDDCEELIPKTYTPTHYVMLGAYKSFVTYSCNKRFVEHKGMMDEIEKISSVMTADAFSTYLIKRHGKYATLTQIIKDVCR